jgi:hypothetical protein
MTVTVDTKELQQKVQEMYRAVATEPHGRDNRQPARHARARRLRGRPRARP